MPTDLAINGILPPVRLAGEGCATQLEVRDGLIVSMARSSLPSEHLCIPAFQDLHLHASRAFTLSGGPPASFDEAADLAVAAFAAWTRDDYRQNAFSLFQRCLTFGTAKVRSHADVDPDSDLQAVEGTLDAASQLVGELDVEVVAFASGRYDPRDRHCQKLLKQAVAAGASHLGGVPNFYDRPDEVIDVFLDLARDLDVHLDLHLDEHLDPARCFSRHLAISTLQRGLVGRVSLSHACAIGQLSDAERAGTVKALVEADIEVIALPATNLYLQDRMSSFPALRGMTPLREFEAAGARLRAASDNIQDCFYPYGSGDMLDVLHLVVTAAQIDCEETLTRLVCGGKSRPQVGDPARLVLLPVGGYREALSNRTFQRKLIGFSHR